MHVDRIPKVTFVLGAGASAQLGYPLGDTLKSEVIKHLTGNGNQVYAALLKSGFTESEIRSFTRQLQRAEYDTIDQHIREIDDPLTRKIGKRAVAYIIRTCENDDGLFHTGSHVRHWYKFVADHLGRYRDHISSDQFSFITFNYDRSLSHYLYDTLLSRRIPDQRLRTFLGDANFFHVHGNVGPLPWQTEEGSKNAYYQYGAHLSVDHLASYTPNILLPDDERESGLMAARIVGESEIIVFVGFGFHRTNVERLPFADSSASGNPRRFFSINPLPPPTDLMLHGAPVRHLRGNVDQIIPQFFQRLLSGDLMKEGKSS